MRQVFKSELNFGSRYSLWLFIFTIGAALQGLAGPTCSQEVDRVDQLLKRGEFAAAEKLANESPTVQHKDRILKRIAAAQQRSGATTQAFATIRKIRNDSTRTLLLQQTTPETFGNRESGGAGTQGQFQGSGSQSGYSSGFGDGAQGGFPGNGMAAGGAAVADFRPLIDLIQNTIDPNSWLDTNGGPGTINEFRSGVTVDAGGMLRKVEFSKSNDALKDIRKNAARKLENIEVFKDSDLRKISLNRLEKECQLLAAEGKSPTEAMERLAGLYEIKYLLLFPETGDVVIAGPAGDWKTDVEGVSVNVRTGKPVFRLDDLVVCLRNAKKFDGKFGCSIDPRQANLQLTQEFIATSRLKGKPWRDGLRDALGRQDISVDGIDPQSVVARVIVEADYRMKLAGMGLEKGVPGAESFLSRIELDKNGNVPPQDIMRLEFVLNYDNVSMTEAGDAFQLNGQGVKVIMEKELVNQKGERIHTGKSVGPAAEFARGFTRHFDAMAARYPIYRQLKNVFDLAMVTNLIRQQKLDQAVQWEMSYFVPASDNQLTYETKKGHIPKEVSTVMNYREIDVRRNGRKLRTHMVVGISGGVTVDAGQLLKSKEILKTDTYGKLRLDRKSSKPATENWWWD